MKILEGKEMVQSIGFLPKELYLELNGNITKKYYSQGFQNLSTTDQSVIAIKLENKAIKLSLEEVKDFYRMNTLNIFKNPFINTTNDVGDALILKLLLPSSS